MVQQEELCKLKKLSDLIGTRNHDHRNSFTLTIFLIAGSGFLDTIVLTPFFSRELKPRDVSAPSGLRSASLSFH
jgi:hypothetical protein